MKGYLTSNQDNLPVFDLVTQQSFPSGLGDAQERACQHPGVLFMMMGQWTRTPVHSQTCILAGYYVELRDEAFNLPV